MFFWLIRGHAAEGLRWTEQILSLPALPPVAEARATLGAAVMRYTQGEHASSRAGAIRALALAQDIDDTDLIAQAEHLFGYVEYGLGDMKAARDRFALSVEGFSTAANPWGAGHALTGLASVALVAGDEAESERLLDEATAALGLAGPWFSSLNLYLRAGLAVRRGKPDQALAFVRVSLGRVRELHDKFAFTYTLVPLAAAAALKADYAWAARTLGMRDGLIEVVLASPLSTGQCTICTNRPNKRPVCALVRSDGPWCTRPDARALSMPCSAKSMPLCRKGRSPIPNPAVT